MKTSFKQTLLVAALSGCILSTSLSYADTSNTAVVAVTQPLTNSVDLTPVQVNSPDIPPNYDTYLLEQGKDVYAQLKIARQAALNKNTAGFIDALSKARDALDKLQVPNQVKALDKQLGIIREDLGKQGGKLNADLWVPVEANLRDALVFSSDTVIDQGIASANKGMQAAHNNDSTIANVALDELVKTSTYNLGVFPLSKVKADLNSASAAADDNSPYWQGALEAIQDALATFQWYDQVPSHGLLAAYTDIANAYAVSSAPDFLPDQQQTVINQLGKAVEALKQSADTSALQAETQTLIDRITPDNSDILTLLQHIQQQIHDQRQQSENQALQAFAAEGLSNP